MATIIGILGLAVSVLALVNDMGHGSDGSSAQDVSLGVGTPASRPANTWPATVVNTWSDEKQHDVGVRSSSSPDVPTPAVHSYFERYTVRVRCQVPGGRLITTSARGQTYQSRVWNLTTQNDWLSSAFLRFDDPTASPRRCGPDERPSPPAPATPKTSPPVR